MLQRDYLMNLLLQFVQAIRHSLLSRGNDPKGSADLLEHALCEATDIDADLLLGLEPSSFAMILRVSSIDEHIVPYVVHSLMLVAEYLREAGEDALADLRTAQAQSLAVDYDVDIDLNHFIDTGLDIDNSNR